MIVLLHFQSSSDSDVQFVDTGKLPLTGPLLVAQKQVQADKLTDPQYEELIDGKNRAVVTVPVLCEKVVDVYLE